MAWCIKHKGQIVINEATKIPKLFPTKEAALEYANLSQFTRPEFLNQKG